MKGNMKVTIVLLVVLLLGGAYLVGSYVATAQMGKQPAQAGSVGDPVAERIAQALEQMSQAMNQMAGHMAMDNSNMTGMMGMMNSMGTMHDQMQQAMPHGQQGMTTMGQQNAPVPAGQLSESDLVRASDEASIAIEATWMNPLLEPENAAGALVFRIALDTHSEDLLQYDLPALAVLRDSKDQILAATLVWEPESESNHHRSGILKAQALDEGKSLLAAAVEGIVLELKDIGTPLRRFEWQVKLTQ